MNAHFWDYVRSHKKTQRRAGIESDEEKSGSPTDDQILAPIHRGSMSVFVSPAVHNITFRTFFPRKRIRRILPTPSKTTDSKMQDSAPIAVSLEQMLQTQAKAEAARLLNLRGQELRELQSIRIQERLERERLQALAKQQENEELELAAFMHQQETKSSTLSSTSISPSTFRDQQRDKAVADLSFIGKGTFGCVYRAPGLACPDPKDGKINQVYHNSTNLQYVSKLALVEHSEHEALMGQKLQAIDPAHRYFVYLEPFSGCTPSLAQIESCTASTVQTYLEKHHNNVDVNEFRNYSLLAGIPYLSYLKEFEQIPVRQLLSQLIQPWEAVVTLHSHNITHRDISRDNMLWGPTTEITSEDRVRLIDFGFAESLLIHHSDWLTLSRFFQNKLVARWPPEYLALSNARVESIIEKLRNRSPLWMQFYKSYSIPVSDLKETWSDNALIKWIQNLHKYFVDVSKMKATTFESRTVEPLNEMLRKSDVFMLAVACYSFWTTFGLIVSAQDQELFDTVRAVWINAMHPVYRDRPNARNVLDTLQALQNQTR